MKAFRVVTVINSRALLNVMVGKTEEEVREQIIGHEEIIEIKEITENLKLDICEISDALRYFKVDDLIQLLVINMLEKYDNLF